MQTKTTNGVAICYVHLGDSPSPTLIDYANISISHLKDAKAYLVTDTSKNWKKFPGEIIQYHKNDRNHFVKSLCRRFPELTSIANGYWISTIERLFALEKLKNVLSKDDIVIHLESDVISFLRNKHLKLFRERQIDVACPRISEDIGIGSLIYARNIDSLILSLDKTARNFKIGLQWRSDMEFLALAQKMNFIENLPIEISDAWKSKIESNRYFIFDGAAIGQFLLGRDSIHSNSRIINGYINPHFKSRITEFKWQLSDEKENPSLIIKYKKKVYEVLCLHVHSKIKIENTKDLIDKIHIAISSITEKRQELNITNHEISTIHTRKEILWARIIRNLRRRLVNIFTRYKIPV